MMKIQECHHPDICKMYLNGDSGEKISKKFNVRKGTIYRILHSNNIKIRDLEHARRTHKVDEFYFNNIDSQEKAYILGIMFSDGNNYEKGYRIAIGMNDKEVITFIKDQLKSDHQITRQKNSYRIDIVSQTMSKRLSQIGCKSRKTYKLNFPSQSIIKYNLIKYFILGCFDGDGCIYKYSNNTFLFHFIGTKSMCMGIKEHLEREVKVKISLRRVNGYTFLYSIYCNNRENIQKILQYLYKDALFKMIRKHNIYLDLCQQIIDSPKWLIYKKAKRKNGKFAKGWNTH